MLPTQRPQRLPFSTAPLSLAAATALLLAASVMTAPSRAATHAVSVGDGFFAAAAITVAVGDTVTWTNDDDSPHTVTSGDGTFDSGNLDPGQQFSFTFTTPGTYAYVCAYHEEMTGTITVLEAAAQPAAPSAAAPSAAAPSPAAVAGSDAAGPTAEQPDTALATPAESSLVPWLGPVLIGLGLVAFAFGLLPALPAGGETLHVREAGGRATRRAEGGWRR